jgi:tRNA threonylcarbamoyladenosine biosynthesis protein TsaE
MFMTDVQEKPDFKQHLADEQATLALGTFMAPCLEGGCVLYLHGDLGAGKTTLTRGIMRGLGMNSTVKSPTYTLVESYDLPHTTVYHFDLYRLADAEELEFMGIRDYDLQDAIIIIEWPELGKGFLPKPDLDIEIRYQGMKRRLHINARSGRGRSVLACLGAAS